MAMLHVVKNLGPTVILSKHNFSGFAGLKRIELCLVK